MQDTNSSDKQASATPPPSTRDYVVWQPAEDSEPAKIRARTPEDAAKLYVFRSYAEEHHHDNDWSEPHLVVADFETGDSQWMFVAMDVKVTS